MHGISTVTQQDRWRPDLAWLGLVAFVILVSLSTNLGEIFYVYVRHDPRALVGRNVVDAAIDDVARMLMLLVGLVILLRAGTGRSCFLLGTGIVALAPFPLPSLAAELAFGLLLGPLTYLMPTFAMTKLRESDIRVSAWVRWLFGVGLAIYVAVYLVSFFPFVGIVSGFSPAASKVIFALSWYCGLLTQLFTVALLGYGWRRAGAHESHRYLLLLLAVSVMVVLGSLLFFIFSSDYPNFPRWITDTSALFRTIGAFLFAYAILKHRVIDIGFAINRTLVYGAVTFTLLAAFGLAEYATNSLIPEQGAEAGSIITAATAVLLFLSFHHLHRWFEHHIERLFFRGWHVAEADLKRFVASAGQFTSQSALCASFADEVRRYMQDAEAALFLASDEADFRLEAGGLTGAEKRYSDEDRAFALMRGEQQPIELARVHSTLPGELASPMLDQRGLAGFVLFGSKPDGSHFRPDQEESIGWATHQVGLDLQALRARALDEELASLRRRVATSEEERDRLVSSLVLARSAAEQPPILVSEKLDAPRQK